MAAAKKLVSPASVGSLLRLSVRGSVLPGQERISIDRRVFG